jgi:NAD(P)-dependent dehydrogenase (short-subunit alcohol dehydrogenase family)
MRRILVTGANKGIGRAIVSAILDKESDTSVVLGSRNLGRGREAIAELVDARPEWADRLYLLELDVSSDGSVARAAAQIAEDFGSEPAPLYAVVNNAGIGLGMGSLRDILEVNTYGVRRVCEAFLPLIDSTNGRIVNLTSASGPNFVSECNPEQQRFFVDEQIEWSALDAFMQDCLSLEGGQSAFAAKGLGDGNAYGLSKACANSYTLLLARENPGLRINACTPGFIETDMTRPYAAMQGQAPADMGMRPPAEGTRSALFLLFGEPDGSGRYYGSDAKRSPLHRYRSPGDPAYTGE